MLVQEHPTGTENSLRVMDVQTFQEPAVEHAEHNGDTIHSFKTLSEKYFNMTIPTVSTFLLVSN